MTLHSNNSLSFSRSNEMLQAKLEEMHVILLMGSQSLRSDPSPSLHPLWRQTARDCPWLLLRCCRPTLRVWPGADSRPGLKLPSAEPGLTTGASSAQPSRYGSTPPSGRLVSDPLLRTGRNSLILFPLVQKPDSDKQQGAGGKMTLERSRCELVEGQQRFTGSLPPSRLCHCVGNVAQITGVNWS